MGKSRKSKPVKDSDDEDEDDSVIEAEPLEKEHDKDKDKDKDIDEDKEEEEKKSDRDDDLPRIDPPRKGFLQQFGEGLKAAGAEAARYTKIGITLAELEKLRFNLRSAYQRLGEAVTRCWDAAPEIGVSASDSDVKDLVKQVSALRRQIREVEAKARDLKNGKMEDKQETKSEEKK